MALKVTQIRSAIGTKPKQRGTLRALGLRGSVAATRSTTGRRSAACWRGCPTSSK
ncbi:MAG: uL30 family ribosomal protein [Acidimicrobiales bacterium]